MYGTGFLEVDGQTVFGANGLPVQDGNLRLLGNYNPDFTIGFNNKFSYKNIDMTILFDWRKGGTIVSRIKALGSTSGVLQETLVGREDGVIGDGVVNVGTVDSPQYVANTTSVPASQFYNNYFDRGNEDSALYSASYVKLRQVGLYYNFPKKIIKVYRFSENKIGLDRQQFIIVYRKPPF
ncbi:hypothetical protein ACU8V7_11480 [Zobellia nedashkovskayae]